MTLDQTREACNAAFQETIDAAIDNRSFPILTSHSEMYRLMSAKMLVVLERFAAPLFGIAGRGAHMTAFVRTISGLKIWVPRRAKHLVTYPGMLDTTVAGGVKADQSPLECIVAESNEEASLPAEFVEENARGVGVVSHCLKSKRSGLFSIAVLYLYDIELSESMIPKPGDDEVEGFQLMSVEEVKAAMFKQEFKPNSSLVMMDFFIRHGIMTEDKDLGYAEIAARLRRRLPVAITPNYS
jgi:isopentenyldiphosphate isomerase